METSGLQAGGGDLRADLVFEGGGVKGIGLAGAYWALERAGYQPACVAGTSAGAITASLVAAGYSGDELKQIVLEQMKFSDFADGAHRGLLGVGGEIGEFLRHRGIHSGDYFLEWIRARLAAKGKHTFGDLRNPAPLGGIVDPKRQYRLRVIASDLSTRSMLVLPDDAPRLGYEPDALPIAEAVRMSMSIPIFFEPWSANGHEIVDGGLLSNYPVWLFDSPPDQPPAFPTFGMLLVAPGQQDPLEPHVENAEPAAPIGSDIDFLKAIGETMMEAHDRFYVDQANYARTIPIDTLGVKTTQFDIQPEQAAALFQSGADAARRFLKTWDFEDYKRRFRTADGPAPRRASVAPAPAPAMVPAGGAAAAGGPDPASGSAAPPEPPLVGTTS